VLILPEGERARVEVSKKSKHGLDAHTIDVQINIDFGAGPAVVWSRCELPQDQTVVFVQLCGRQSCLVRPKSKLFVRCNPTARQLGDIQKR
jgi:hypothetical protein